MRTILTYGLLALATCVSIDAAEVQLHAPMPVEQAKARSLDWAASRGLTDKTMIDAVGKLWSTGTDPLSADELHERVVQTAALIEPTVRELVGKCQFGTLSIPSSDVMKSDKLDPFMSHNLRAFVMKFLAQAGFFDEGHQLAVETDIKQLVDPATYLFFKAVCEHRLLMKTEGLATLKLLRQNTASVPVRYSSLAELMEKDLEVLEEKTLNEVARLMSDAERRLNLGRGGERVQKVEEDIVARLDEIIKKLEAQQSGGGGGGGKGGDSKQNQSGGPAGDSRVKGQTAPGEVDKRDIGHKSGWGALPPKEQAKAKNLIDRELPPHYRNAIEQYLKKLATRPQANPTK